MAICFHCNENICLECEGGCITFWLVSISISHSFPYSLTHGMSRHRDPIACHSYVGPSDLGGLIFSWLIWMQIGSIGPFKEPTALICISDQSPNVSWSPFPSWNYPKTFGWARHFCRTKKEIGNKCFISTLPPSLQWELANICILYIHMCEEGKSGKRNDKVNLFFFFLIYF